MVGIGVTTTPIVVGASVVRIGVGGAVVVGPAPTVWGERLSLEWVLLSDSVWGERLSLEWVLLSDSVLGERFRWTPCSTVQQGERFPLERVLLSESVQVERLSLEQAFLLKSV